MVDIDVYIGNEERQTFCACAVVLSARRVQLSTIAVVYMVVHR